MADVYAAVEDIVQRGHGNVSKVGRFLGVCRTSMCTWQTAEPIAFDAQDAQLARLKRGLFKRQLLPCNKFWQRQGRETLRLYWRNAFCRAGTSSSALSVVETTDPLASMSQMDGLLESPQNLTSGLFHDL